MLLLTAVAALSALIASHRGLPNVLVIMAVLIALYAFVTTRTTVGRQIYAVGGNEKAAKLSGIATERRAATLGYIDVKTVPRSNLGSALPASRYFTVNTPLVMRRP